MKENISISERSSPPQLRISSMDYSISTARSVIHVLNNINLDVYCGEIVAIVGPSGCGKSTLIHLASGFLKADRGTVSLDGEPVSEPSLRIGIMFQDLGLLPWRTVRGNIQFAIENMGQEKSDVDTRVEKLVSSVGLTGFEDFYPHELSGGMAQRVALARTLAPEPKVLLMDEPFRSLDAQTRLMMQEELLRLWEADRRTIVFVTHDVDEAVFLASRIIVLTARPATVRDVFDVPLPRPRTAATRYRSDYVTIRNHVLSSVSEETEVANWINEHASKRPVDEIWIGYVDTLAESLPFRVAEQLGIFKMQNLCVRLWPFRNGLKIASLVAEGYLHGGSVGPVALLCALDRTDQISKVIASAKPVTKNSRYAALCVKSGSCFVRIEDLRDKRIAVNGFQTMCYDLLKQCVLDEDIYRSIEIVPLAFGEMSSAMQQGAIDAAMVFEPFISIGLANGSISILAEVTDALTESCLSVVLFRRVKHMVAAELVSRVSDALLSTVRMIKQDPALARKTMASIAGIPESALEGMALPLWEEKPDFTAIGSLVKPLAARGILAHPEDVLQRLHAIEQQFMVVEKRTNV